MPYSCGAATHSVAARNRARMLSIVIAVRTLKPVTGCVRPNRGRHRSPSKVMCNNQPNRSQRTNQDFDTQAKKQPLFTSLLDEAYIGSGENGKRYRRHQPASHPGERLAGTYPYSSKQSNPAFHTRYPAATAVQPKLAQERAYTFSPPNLHFCGADGGAPV
jgi:hypothetical protein